jgi:hypothetical protein
MTRSLHGMPGLFFFGETNTMAASVSGSKTVTTNISPALTAGTLTTILATAPENMTVAQLDQLRDALKRVPFGHTASSVIGALLR